MIIRARFVYDTLKAREPFRLHVYQGEFFLHGVRIAID